MGDVVPFPNPPRQKKTGKHTPAKPPGNLADVIDFARWQEEQDALVQIEGTLEAHCADKAYITNEPDITAYREVTGTVGNTKTTYFLPRHVFYTLAAIDTILEQSMGTRGIFEDESKGRFTTAATYLLNTGKLADVVWGSYGEQQLEEGTVVIQDLYPRCADTYLKLPLVRILLDRMHHQKKKAGECNNPDQPEIYVASDLDIPSHQLFRASQALAQAREGDEYDLNHFITEGNDLPY